LSEELRIYQSFTDRFLPDHGCYKGNIRHMIRTWTQEQETNEHYAYEVLPRVQRKLEKTTRVLEFKTEELENRQRLDAVQINYELDSQQIVEKPAKADSEITMLDIGQVNVLNGRSPNLGSKRQIQKDEDETVTDNSNSLMTDSIPYLSNDE
jgi:hypothetical protein